MSQDPIKIAVIDLGTNTFHTVIFKQIAGEIKEIYRKRHHVFLFANSVNDISQSAFERIKIAIEDFKIALEHYQPTMVKIIGTEALRIASNGKEISNYIEQSLNCEVEIISGEREAELITKGVVWEFEGNIENTIIMDIGGGSVEFIHYQNKKIQWMKSFPIGVGILFNAAKHSEPIKLSEIQKLEAFIENKTGELLEYLKGQNIDTLVGCSGSFELIPSIQEGAYPPFINKIDIELAEFYKIHKLLIHASIEERQQIKGLPPVRAQLVIVAFVLMHWFIKKSNVKQIKISKYAVKEGLASEYLFPLID